MKYIIYQIRNTVNGKIYIGKHQTYNIDDGYFGSGIALKNAIKKYGKDNFVKEILYMFDTEEDMNAKERELITEEFVKRKDTYNLGIGGEGGPHFKGKKHTEETKEKIKSNTNYSEIAKKLKEKYSNGELVVWNKGLTGVVKEDIKNKISEFRTGKKHSVETIEKIKLSRQKQSFSEETRRKMSESAKNRKK
jgi:hypothetical protein